MEPERVNAICGTILRVLMILEMADFAQDRGTRTVEVPKVSLRSVRFLTGLCVATAAL